MPSNETEADRAAVNEMYEALEPWFGPDEITDRRNIHQRMVAIVGELPAIGKTRRNEQQGFNFRGSDDVLDQLNPLLAKHGVYYLPETLERIYDARQTAKGTVMHTTSLHVRFTFYGLLGDRVVASTWGESMDSFDKSTSKAHTMAMKYCLFEALCITVSEVTDSDKYTPEETVARGTRAAPPKKLDPVKDLGWETKEQANEEHKRLGDRVKALAEADQGILEEWRKKAGIGWPCKPEELQQFEERVEAIEGGWEDPDTHDDAAIGGGGYE